MEINDEDQVKVDTPSGDEHMQDHECTSRCQNDIDCPLCEHNRLDCPICDK